MRTFTSEEADYLIQYYNGRMIGEYLERFSKFKIIRLEKEEVESSQFTVVGVALEKDNITPRKRSVRSIASDLGLLDPETVLQSEA